VLACLAVVMIACAVKNYLTLILSGTALCPHLCPSAFPSERFFEFPLLELVFETQRWAQEESQALVDLIVRDPWNLATTLMFAPAYEELVFRGPLFLTRGRIPRPLWWSAGILLSVLFTLSHGRSGLALLPLFALGLCGLWLISTTHRFWPTLALHFLHNFFFTSALLYQAAWYGD
jgi:membrane protease YdiL (CAAX protease family)